MQQQMRLGLGGCLQVVALCSLHVAPGHLPSHPTPLVFLTCRVFLRAIGACPGAKAIWTDGLALLNGVAPPKELTGAWFAAFHSLSSLQ